MTLKQSPVELFFCICSVVFLVQADQPDYWDQVYKLQGEHGRALYEWYGLGRELTGVRCFFGSRFKAERGGYQQLRSSLMELLEPLQHSQRVTGAVRPRVF